MSIHFSFANIEHLFKNTEEHVAHALSSVLHRIAGIIEDALPAVALIAGIASKVEAEAPNKVTEEVLKYIPTVVTDAAAVDAFSKQYADAPLKVFLHEAALFLVQHTKGHLQTDIKDLDTAVQAAYAVFSEPKAA